MKHLKIVFVLCLCLSGCATLKEDRTLQFMTLGTSAGVVFGATRPENPDLNAIMYGSIGLAAGALIGMLLEEKPPDARATGFEGSQNREPSKKIVSQGSSLFSVPLPSEFKRIVREGGWKRYKLDRWVQDEENENTWFRQTEMFEVIPPSIGTN